MPMVPAKCTQCGQNLQIDDTKEAAVCPYCGTAFITEKAINQYKFEIGSVVVEGVSVETKLNNAEIFFKMHGDDNRARELFEEVTDLAPADWRGWWGLVRISTKEFTCVRVGSELIAHIEENAKRAFNCAKASDPQLLIKLEEQWTEYVQRVNSEWRDGVVESLSQAVEEKSRLEAEIKEKEAELFKTSEELSKTEKEQRRCDSMMQKPSPWIYGLSVLLCFCYGVGLLILIPLIVRAIYYADKNRKLEAKAKELRCARDNLTAEVYTRKKQVRELEEKIDKTQHNLKYADD